MSHVALSRLVIETILKGDYDDYENEPLCEAFRPG